MKKKVLRLMIMVAIFGFLPNLAVNVAEAKMSTKAQHKLYQKTIAKYDKAVKKCAKKYDMTGYCTYYVFVDIDKNGTDECILRYGSESGGENTANGSGRGETTSIYTIKNGKVKTVLDHSDFDPQCHDSYVHIFKNSNMIDMGFSHGYKDYYFCRYKNGKIDEKNGIQISYSESSGEQSASINEKKTTVAKCKKKYKQLSNNGKGYKMKKYK